MRTKKSTPTPSTSAGAIQKLSIQDVKDLVDQAVEAHEQADVAERKLSQAEESVEELRAKLSETLEENQNLLQQMFNERDRENAAVRRAMQAERMAKQLKERLSEIDKDKTSFLQVIGSMIRRVDESENSSPNRLAEGRKQILERAWARGIDYRILLEEGEVDPLLDEAPANNNVSDDQAGKD